MIQKLFWKVSKLWGTEILNKLEGQFSFVIYDKEKQTLFMARDRVGQKPLFYSFSDERFIIASTIEPIVKLLKTFEVDSQSMYTFLQLGVVPAPKTIFQNIFKLKNAEFILVDIQKNQIKKRVHIGLPNNLLITKNSNMMSFYHYLKKQLKNDV